MYPLIFNLGPTELIIILVIVLLLFGGSRLAGLGKSTGRALKEFKEETKGLRDKDEPQQGRTSPYDTSTPEIAPYPPQQTAYGQPQQNDYNQPQSAQQPRPDTNYGQAPGNVDRPAGHDVRRDV